jgi:hypothetical protein
MPMMLFAQNGVTVSNLSVESGAVTFEVSWDKAGVPSVWSDSVWVFVDYNNNGVMKRLELSSGSTLTETSAPGVGEVIEEPNNNKGVWVVGNARSAGSFSAMVQLLTTINDVAGACVYASNYPPLGEWKEDGSGVLFTGTPMYKIILEETATGSTLTAYSDGSYTLPAGHTIKSFSDATGAPGTFHCIPPAAPTVIKGEFCYEQPGELVAVASGGTTIEWYNALTGTLLHTGETLSLPPLYDASAQYYAQAVAERNCRSVRINADYTVRNCTISGDCPNYTAGNVGAPNTPASCATHYAGQIGVTGSSASSVCLAHDAGRIGGGAVVCDPPTAPTVLNASTQTAYVGQLITLTATGGGDGSGAQYEWGTGAAGTGSSVKTTANTYQVSPVTTTTYWVRRVSTVGCGAPTAAAVTTITIKSYPPGGPESEVCRGYVIGAIGTSGTTGEVGMACAAHYAGQIGATTASPSCVAHDTGRIGN